EGGLRQRRRVERAQRLGCSLELARVDVLEREVLAERHLRRPGEEVEPRDVARRQLVAPVHTRSAARGEARALGAFEIAADARRVERLHGDREHPGALGELRPGAAALVFERQGLADLLGGRQLAVLEPVARRDERKSGAVQEAPHPNGYGLEGVPGGAAAVERGA